MKKSIWSLLLAGSLGAAVLVSGCEDSLIFPELSTTTTTTSTTSSSATTTTTMTTTTTTTSTTTTTITPAWSSNFGGTDLEGGYCVIQTADNGYLLCGSAKSNDNDVSGNHGGFDYWLVKLDRDGVVEWSKCYGGTFDEYAYDVKQTADGGYIVAGLTNSNDGDVSGKHGKSDYWIVKLDASGSLTWQKCLGSSDDDAARVIKLAADGGYIVGGFASAADGDVTGNRGMMDVWIAKLSSSGALEMGFNLGGSNDDYIYDLFELESGNILFCATSKSTDFDVVGNHGAAGTSDFWIGEATTAGAIQWRKCLGGTLSDELLGASTTADGGYLLIGSTFSTDGDVSGNHGNQDIWLVKVDATGAFLWQKCLGGTNNEQGWSARRTADSGFLLAGTTNSTDGNVGGNHGTTDMWVVKLNSGGLVEWQHCFGGTSADDTKSMTLTSDGGYAVLGSSLSSDYDVPGNHGVSDYWSFKRPAVTAP